MSGPESANISGSFKAASIVPASLAHFKEGSTARAYTRCGLRQVGWGHPIGAALVLGSAFVQKKGACTALLQRCCSATACRGTAQTLQWRPRSAKKHEDADEVAV